MACFFIFLLLLTMGYVGKIGYAGHLNEQILEEGAPEGAIVYFEAENQDMTFVVWEGEIELYGEDVMGSDLSIPISEVQNTKLGGTTLNINNDRGQLSVLLSGFGRMKARKAKEAIDALLE